eukprot:Rhum_TRINITY_DN14585_c9_g3::Rhum_TRINITY_DN14585_c9_g3_i4::g.101168::m.101168
MGVIARKSHSVAAFLSMVGVLFVSCLIADGRSIAVSRASGNRDVFPKHPFGLGVYYDQDGRVWNERENFARGFTCGDHERRGQAMKAWSFIILVISFAATAVHLVGASSGSAAIGGIGAGLQFLLFASWVILFAVTLSFWNGSFWCDDLKHKLVLRDNFELSYGITFEALGMLMTLVSLVLMAAKGAKGDAPATAHKELPTTDEE